MENGMKNYENENIAYINVEFLILVKTLCQDF